MEAECPMTTLDLPAPAKLNLFLHITGRRDDGYHTLQTLFQFLDRSDRLRITPRHDGRLVVHGPDWLPATDNLITHAAERLKHHTGTRQGADIELTKQLPAGAGWAAAVPTRPPRSSVSITSGRPASAAPSWPLWDWHWEPTCPCSSMA